MTTPYVTDEQFRDFARKETHGAETPQGDAPETFPGMPTDLAGFRNRWPTLAGQVEVLSTELETERLRLAACSVAAMMNTPGGVAARLTPASPYHSSSYRDVCETVDREMKYRKAIKDAMALILQGEPVDAHALLHKALEV